MGQVLGKVLLHQLGNKLTIDGSSEQVVYSGSKVIYT